MNPRWCAIASRSSTREKTHPTNTQQQSSQNKDLLDYGTCNCGSCFKDTVFKETLNIITKNDSLYLQVTGVNEKPTLFKFTQQTDSSFTAENKLNEFPKMITYWKENNFLKAKVANDEFSVDFIFKKMIN